jgi:hypothetical protein
MDEENIHARPHSNPRITPAPPTPAPRINARHYREMARCDTCNPMALRCVPLLGDAASPEKDEYFDNRLESPAIVNYAIALFSGGYA